MPKYAVILLIMFFSSCLEDGRSEVDYIREYGQFVDLEQTIVPGPYSTEDGNYQSDIFVIRREETDACSSPKSPHRNLTIIQNVQPSIRVHKVGPESDCQSTYLFDLPMGVGSRIPAWEGVVYRFIDYDGVLIMEVEIGKIENVEALVVE